MIVHRTNSAGESVSFSLSFVLHFIKVINVTLTIFFMLCRNPPYGEHVKWLLRISKRLGAQYLHQFCVCAVNSVVSPFVLYELCVESAHWLARGGPHHLVMQHLRGTLAPLVQKCQQM